MTREILIATCLSLLGCGGASPHPAPPGDPATAARRVASAREAWAALAPERAAQAAEDAILLGARGEAQEIAARARLLLGAPDAAIHDLEGASDPELLRLRARALLIAGRWAEADATLTVIHQHDEPDTWTESMHSICGAMRGVEHPYALGGTPEASVAMLDAPLPLVRMRVDTTEVIALVGTSAQLVVLDPAVRAQSGAIDELAIEGMRIAHVPHTVRDLAEVRNAIGQDVRAVIGFQLLARLHATLDGPGHRLTLRSSEPRRGEGASAPLLTPSGAFVVIVGQIGESPMWLDVDTAGLFPVALAPDAIDTFSLGSLEWHPVPGASGAEVAMLPTAQLGSLAVEDVPVVRGLIDAQHAATLGAPVAGSIGWVVLSQLSIGFDPEARRLRFE